MVKAVVVRFYNCIYFCRNRNMNIYLAYQQLELRVPKVIVNKEKGRLSQRVTHKYLMRNRIAQENDIDINPILASKQSRKQICVHFLSVETNAKRAKQYL